MRTIGRTFDRPLMANMVESGRTPIADRKTLEELGFSIAIFPALGFLAAGDALRKVYRHLRDHGSGVDVDAALYKFGEFSDLMGFRAIAQFEELYRRSREAGSDARRDRSVNR